MGSDVAPTVPDRIPGGYEVTGRLHDICEAVATRLQGLMVVQSKGIRVLPEYHGDMFNQLASVMNKRLGMLVVVGIDDGGINSQQRGIGTFLKDIGIKVSVFESILFNQGATGSKVSALALAELTLSRLHDWQPSAEEVAVPGILYMREEKTLFLDMERSKPESGLICYTTRFFTSGCALTEDDIESS